MARVRVRMFATVREAAGTAEVEIEASTLTEALGTLARMFGRGITEMVSSAKGSSEGMVVLVNGRNAVAGRDVRLKDGDDIAIFPPVSGG